MEEYEGINLSDLLQIPSVKKQLENGDVIDISWEDANAGCREI